MARLGGEFAVLMLVSMPADRFSGLEEGLGSTDGPGLQGNDDAGRADLRRSPPGWLPYRVEVQGADHEGIIHEVAHYLSSHGISIESMDSETPPAPTSGSPLFAMTAQVVVPPGRAGTDWEAGSGRDRRSLEPGHPGVSLSAPVVQF